jgi:hypothetical protein
MNTFAPLTGRPPRAVIRTRTTIGAVLPTRAVPVIEGSVVFTGLAAVAMFVGSDVAVSWPSPLRPMTCERSGIPHRPAEACTRR